MTTPPPSRYDYAFDPQDDSTAARVCRLVGHGRRVLELGCAAGAMSAVLHEHYGCTVTGVERDADALAHARAHCDAVIQADLDDTHWAAQLSDPAFDTVVAADVLEHLRDPLRGLRQIHTLLRPEGGLVVSVPNIAHSGVLAALLNNDFPYADTGLLDRTHIHFFTTLTLGRMLHEAGFQVDHVETVDTGAHHPEFQRYWATLPATLWQWLAEQPAGRPFQIIMKARAVANGPASQYTDSVQQRALAWLREQDDKGSGSPESRAASPQTDDSEALAQALERAQAAEAALQSVLASRSWRITAPLRRLKRRTK